jgi:hypothetical protein
VVGFAQTTLLSSEANEQEMYEEEHEIIRKAEDGMLYSYRMIHCYLYVRA